MYTYMQLTNIENNLQFKFYSSYYFFYVHIIHLIYNAFEVAIHTLWDSHTNIVYIIMDNC
jgi:hypothetical protein